MPDLRARLRLTLLALVAAAVLLGGTAWPGGGTVATVRAADPTTDPAPTPAADPKPSADPELYPVPVPGRDVASEGVSSDCVESADPVAAADRLMADRYTLGAWPAVVLPHDPDWSEDPYADASWRFRYHSLRYVLDLENATIETGDPAYLARGLELVQDWLASNPRVNPPSDMSWNDHSTALRAVVLTCLADTLPDPQPDWLPAALRLHGETLADPAFYVNEGNHALNQSIGLLEIGRVLGDDAWMDLAEARIAALIQFSIDKQGVINEGSLGYHLYNYQRYSVARARLLAVGREPVEAFKRVDRMPRFLAYGTLPWGRYELIGDTIDGPATPIPGTWAEFAATRGRSGPRPPSDVRWFKAGYLFARSGWGEDRAFRRETALSVRWGPRAIVHGHDDTGSLTLAAWGSRLLLDPGLYAYSGGPFRGFMRGRTAHNVVTVDGVKWAASGTSRLVGVQDTSRVTDVRLRVTGYPDVDHRRRVTYVKGVDVVVVEDRLTSSKARTFRQLWHLPPESLPVVGRSVVRTRNTQGNVQVRQLAGDVETRIVKGQTSPIQGWVSLTYAGLRKAPVVEAVQRGRSVRYVTLLVPSRYRADYRVLAFTRTAGGYALRVRVGDRVQRIVVDGATVSVTG